MVMDQTPPGRPGLVDSFRSLGEGLLASVQGRLELLSVELHEEKFRLIQIFFWISAALFSGMLAITFASLTLVYIFWETARIAVLGGLAAFYVAAFAAIAFGFKRYLARQPRPFAATMQELQEDRACIRKES